MNQYTAKRCPIHGEILKFVYVKARKDRRNRDMKVYEDPKCIKCLRDHDVVCPIRGNRAKITIID